MQELTDQDLAGVAGGTWSFPTSLGGNSSPNSSSAGTTATSSASGQHAASAQQGSQSVTLALPFPGSPSASFSLGFAAGVGY